MRRTAFGRARKFRGLCATGSVHTSDALLLLQSLPDGIADLVFLDPPFNLGKRYSRNKTLDRKPEDVYEVWIHSILDEVDRILKPGGALYLYHIPSWALKFGNYLARTLELRHWIAIAMKNGFARGERLYPAHYALLYFTKGEPHTFRRPKLAPVRCRHCGDVIKDYGGYWPIVKRKGLNLSDVWEDLSPVRHSNRKTRVQNELPQLLMDRVLKISGCKHGIYVDPFVGAGSGVLAAVNAGMHFVVGDLLKKNAELTIRRLEKYVAANRKKTGRGHG